MKRLSIVALILGAIIGALVIIARASGVLQPLEAALGSALAGSQPPEKMAGAALQSLLVVILSIATVWLVLTSTQKAKVSWILGGLILELLVVCWVGQLYHVFFQPLPSVLAVLLGLAAAHGYGLFDVPRAVPQREDDFFTGRLSQEQIARINSGGIAFQATPTSYEATAVVCDIANKQDLTDECPPALVAEITDKFIQHATDSFLKAGAYIETVTGEGVVAVFGFPAPDAQQAEKATRHALSLLESFEKIRTSSKDECFQKFSVHLGISSGTIVVVPRRQDERASLFATGEPVELARRLCIANRFYGSRILIGPSTFELAGHSIVARPIDFLTGADAHDRHEIYEPLKLSTEVSPEEIARRDFFWNGVVLYREKRWAEAYSQFQKARGPDGFDDAPLQFYVRRLEPLALQLVDSSLD